MTQSPAGWGNRVQEEAAKPQPHLTVQAVLGSPVKCNLPNFSLQPSGVESVEGNWWLLCADVCRRQWAHLKTCRKLEEAGVQPFLGEFVPDGKNTFGLIVSLVAYLEFRVTSFLFVITAQMNPLHPVQIISMSCVQSEVKGNPAVDVVCVRQLANVVGSSMRFLWHSSRPMPPLAAPFSGAEALFQQGSLLLLLD